MVLQELETAIVDLLIPTPNCTADVGYNRDRYDVCLVFRKKQYAAYLKRETDCQKKSKYYRQPQNEMFDLL